MIALTRDYQTLQKSYESMLAKQVDSKVAANLEVAAGGEQFQVLDRARLPEAPASPNRPLINLIGALAGLAVGLGLAALVEYRDKSFHTEEEIVSCLSLPVLALVPVMTTATERRRAKRGRVLRSFAAAAVVLVAAAGALAWKLGWLGPLLLLAR